MGEKKKDSRFKTRRVRRGQKKEEPEKDKEEVRSAEVNAADYAKLFHSSLMELDYLKRTLGEPSQRTQTPLEYLGLWGTRQVNINTAPRHVLEAAFTFGGSEVAIAEEIIRRRQEKPYESVKELTDELSPYKTQIDDASDYLAAASEIFRIRIECTSGIARCHAVAAVVKKNKNVEKLVILYSR